MRYQINEYYLRYILDACESLQPYVVPAVIDAAHAEIERLEAEIDRLKESRDGTLALQRHQFEENRKKDVETFKRHQEEERQLVANIGFAAKINDRVMAAERAGRKTVKIADLLEGRPEHD